ncbi:hypothetical protein GINT2_000031 [Glugoides intestinalis]
MGYINGIVPKYLFLHTLVKLILDVYDIKRGYFLPSSFRVWLFKAIKLALITFSIAAIKYRRRKTYTSVTILLVLLETIGIFYQKNRVGKLRIYSEIFLGFVSFVFLIFLFPSYFINPDKTNTKNKKVE